VAQQQGDDHYDRQGHRRRDDSRAATYRIDRWAPAA